MEIKATGWKTRQKKKKTYEVALLMNVKCQNWWFQLMCSEDIVVRDSNDHFYSSLLYIKIIPNAMAPVYSLLT